MLRLSRPDCECPEYAISIAESTVCDREKITRDAVKQNHG